VLAEAAAAAGMLKMYETTLHAGELIFIPAGFPHQVLNEKATVAISSNFIDSTNLKDALKVVRKQLRNRPAAPEGQRSGLDLDRVEARLASLYAAAG
jgi:hypothetical protein